MRSERGRGEEKGTLRERGKECEGKEKEKRRAGIYVKLKKKTEGKEKLEQEEGA